MSHCESVEVDLNVLHSTSFNQSKDNSLLNFKQHNLSSATKSPGFAKPFRREHPQEEQLQRFKKEFEAWQESKLLEFSSNFVRNSIGKFKNEQFFSLENFDNEKVVEEIEDCISVNKLTSTQDQLLSTQSDGNFGKQLIPYIEDVMTGWREPESRIEFLEKRSALCSPTRIVILKPNSDMNDEMKELWPSSPEALEKSGSLEDFLEEVKKRLISEIDGKGRNDSNRWSNASQASLYESSVDTKQHSTMIQRSESTRFYRNGFHFDGEEFWNSIKKETRKFAFDRLKDVLKEKARSKSVKRASFGEEMNSVNESVPKLKLSSNFVSSSEIALLENRPVATETRISRKHEASKNDLVVIKKSKIDGFNIKRAVSNLRRNLSMKGGLFRRKLSSMGDSTVGIVHYEKLNETMASFVIDFDIVQDNSTEVPPSPASFPGSPISVHCSPVSPLEIPFSEDHSSTQVSGELNTTIPNFESQTEHIETIASGMATEPQLNDSNETILIEGSAEDFIRDVLDVSGLYWSSGPLDQTMFMLDGQVKPISSWVFDQVDKNCEEHKNVDAECSMVNLRGIKIDRNMLFDLSKEALINILRAPMTQLIPKRSINRQTQLSHGRELLDDLLNQIQIIANTKVDFDDVVWDVKLMPWSTAYCEDKSSLGREVERLIVGELIDDFLSDLLV